VDKMGFIDKSDLVIDAILTNKGRDYLRKAVFGQNQNQEHVITKFALSDDEIDYGLWDETVEDGDITFTKQYGKVIDNQPVTEPNVNWRSPSDSEVMRYLLFKRIIEKNDDSTSTYNPNKEGNDETPYQVGKENPKGDGLSFEKT
tara:strand:+ start:17775 stop:18209 length:435 start_codon:yes stop_codon:yes gene_type:complete